MLPAPPPPFMQLGAAYSKRADKVPDYMMMVVIDDDDVVYNNKNKENCEEGFRKKSMYQFLK
jgi:hypothetical protein